MILGGHRLLPAADRPVAPADDPAEGDLPDPAGRPGPAGGLRRVRPGPGRGHAEGDRRDEGPRQDRSARSSRWRTSSCRWAGRGARCCTTSACGPGVDDVRSLAAILIQADRFGSSIAQALRVQSDSMRTRRRQIGRGEGGEDGRAADLPAGAVHLPGDLRGAGRPGGDPDPEEPVEGLIITRRGRTPRRVSRRRAMNRLFRAALAAAILPIGLGVRRVCPQRRLRVRRRRLRSRRRRRPRRPAAARTITATWYDTVLAGPVQLRRPPGGRWHRSPSRSHNGHVLTRRSGTSTSSPARDKLTAGGMDKLDSMAHATPGPGPAALPPDGPGHRRTTPENIGQGRRRCGTTWTPSAPRPIQKYLATQSAAGRSPTRCSSTTPPTPGIAGDVRRRRVPRPGPRLPRRSEPAVGVGVGRRRQRQRPDAGQCHVDDHRHDHEHRTSRAAAAPWSSDG